MRVRVPISLSEQDRQILRRWSRGRRMPARLVMRAKIVLRAAQGQQNKQIAAELDITEQTASRWRTHGEAPRSGHPQDHRDHDAAYA